MVRLITITFKFDVIIQGDKKIMTTFTIRSGKRDEEGTVMYTIEVDGKTEYSNLEFTKATKKTHNLAKKGDIIQEADGDKDPHKEILCQRFYLVV